MVCVIGFLALLLPVLIRSLDNVVEYNVTSYSTTLTFDAVSRNRCDSPSRKDGKCYDPTKNGVMILMKDTWLTVTVDGINEVVSSSLFACPTTNCNLTVLQPSDHHGLFDAKIWEAKPKHPKQNDSQVWIYLDLECSVGKVRGGGVVEHIPHIDFVASHTRLSRKNLWQPLSYIDADLGMFRIHGAPFRDRKRPICTFISNHKPASDRENILHELEGSFQVFHGESQPWKETFPSCLGTRFVNSHYNAIKECTYFHSFFAFSIENSYEGGYMTEKVWQALKMGAIPIMEHRDLFQSFLPVKEAAIFVEDFPSVRELAEYMTAVSRYQTLWREHVQWKELAMYFWSGRFKRLVQDSSYNAACLLCERVHQIKAKTLTFETIVKENTCIHDLFVREYIHPIARSGDILTPDPFSVNQRSPPSAIDTIDVLYILMPAKYSKESMVNRLDILQSRLKNIISKHVQLEAAVEVYLVDVYNEYSLGMDAEIVKCFLQQRKEQDEDRIALLNHLYAYYHMLVYGYQRGIVMEYENTGSEAILQYPSHSSEPFDFLFPSQSDATQSIAIKKKEDTAATSSSIELNREQTGHYIVSRSGALSIFQTLSLPVATSLDAMLNQYLFHHSKQSSPVDDHPLNTPPDSRNGRMQHNPASFVELYEKYVGVCSNPEHNVVLPRRDSYNVDLAERRMWSMNAKTMFDFTNVQYEGSYMVHQVQQKPSCDSVAAIIDSVAYPVAQQPCQIAWFSADQVCQILHQYALVWWSGDSLTRQQSQALFMLLTNDLQYGGIPLKQETSLSSYEKCGCDGQFSEAAICREQMNFPRPPADVGTGTHLYLEDWSEWGLCSKYSRDEEHSIFAMDSVNWVSINAACPPSKKPIFIQLQFGHHCMLDVDKCAPQAIERMKVINDRFHDCMDRVKIVFVGATVCSEEVVRKYPHQNKEHVLEYNRRMKEWFQAHYPQVLHVQYWNMTNDAVDRTSDGFHPLSDLNLIKAITTLNIMHHLV